MKIIIVAAGMGQRLLPFTEDRPKCMVEYKGKKIIDHILDVVEKFSFDKVIVIDGYKKEKLETYLTKKKVTFYTNKKFDLTNMVYTLFCAEKEMDDDIIISYADIIYKKEVLEKLIKSKSDISVVIDNKWLDLWKQRMENPLDDAETLKLDANGYIIELGKKPKNYNDIQGQYIGLIKFSKNVINKIKKIYYSLDENKLYDGKNKDNIYMTSFLQLIINNLIKIKSVKIDGGWLEIDSLDDLNSYMVNE